MTLMVNNSQHTMVDTHTHSLNGRSEYTHTRTHRLCSRDVVDMMKVKGQQNMRRVDITRKMKMTIGERRDSVVLSSVHRRLSHHTRTDRKLNECLPSTPRWWNLQVEHSNRRRRELMFYHKVTSCQRRLEGRRMMERWRRCRGQSTFPQAFTSSVSSLLVFSWPVSPDPGKPVSRGELRLRRSRTKNSVCHGGGYINSMFHSNIHHQDVGTVQHHIQLKILGIYRLSEAFHTGQPETIPAEPARNWAWTRTSPEPA